MTDTQKLNMARNWLHQQPYAGALNYWLKQAEIRYELNQLQVTVLKQEFSRLVNFYRSKRS